MRLTATPDNGFRFVGWSGACSGTGKCMVKMNRARSVMATFERVGDRNRPDFVVTGVELTPARPTAGDTFTVRVTVENRGSAAGDGGYLDVWSNEPAARTCGDEGQDWVEIGNLAAGASNTLALPKRFRAGRIGRKTLRAYADSWCETKELRERNNQYTKGYRVR